MKHIDPKQVFSLEGKTALITGGAIGLGATIAEHFAAFGANIVLADIDLDGAQATAAALAQTGVKAIGVKCDVGSAAEVQQAVDTTVREMGGLHILVNNAGINVREPALEVSEEHWDRILRVNLKGVFLFSQAAGRAMVKQGYGKIINMASIQGVIAMPLRTAYCASKGGVIQLTKQLAIEWAKYGIRVNAIAPSFFITPMNTELFDNKEWSGYITEHTPLGRPGEADELGGSAVFLASPASDYITGHVLLVDGGWTAT
jgi:NAD(P)-dependent dehydrogenase (short-subunit alcohol dehydrogenase family)